MSHHVEPYLLSILRRAVVLGVDEVRFLSGQLPAFRAGAELDAAADAPARGALIEELHGQCLRQAQRDELVNEAAATYQFSLPALGSFRCKFRRSGAAPELRITPEPTGGLVPVSPSGNRPPPAVAATEPLEPQ